MRLVPDANIVLACLLRDGATRRLLLQSGLDLYAPPWLWQELDQHRALVLRKSTLRADALEGLLKSLASRITTVKPEDLRSHMDAAESACKDDPFDAAYLAVCLASRADLWTHDKVFAQAATHAGIRVWTTAQLSAIA